jgi:Rrf2 family protein
MQALARARIVESVAGRHGGYQLARPPEAITMLDVVLAIDGPEPAFRCGEIRQRGPSAVAPAAYINPCGIAGAMWRAEAAFRDALRATTIGDLVAELDAEVTPEQTEQALDWLAERLSPSQQSRQRSWQQPPTGAS